MTQNFKGDPTELKFYNAGREAFDSCTIAKDQFFAGAYTAGDFMLMLYDAGRMPFVARVPRDTFVSFIRQAIPNSRFMGTFESYLFILRSIFGANVGVQFTVPDPGQLEVEVNAAGFSSRDVPSAYVDFDWVAKRIEGSSVFIDELVTSDGEQMILSAITGIETEGQLQALFAELIPAGILTTITLTFFTISQWITDGLDQDYTIVASNGDEIVFYEP